MIWEKKLQPYLKASQCDFKWHVQWPVDDSSDRLNEGHEEQWEPDDTDQQHYNHPSHPILHHLLLLLASRLGIPLWRDEMKDGEVYYLTSMQNSCSFFCRLCLSNFTFFLLQQTWFYMCSMSELSRVVIKVKMEQIPLRKVLIYHSEVQNVYCHFGNIEHHRCNIFLSSKNSSESEMPANQDQSLTFNLKTKVHFSVKSKRRDQLWNGFVSYLHVAK